MLHMLHGDIRDVQVDKWRSMRAMYVLMGAVLITAEMKDLQGFKKQQKRLHILLYTNKQSDRTPLPSWSTKGCCFLNKIDMWTREFVRHIPDICHF